ncbi:MAG: hypothetical protein IPJ71_07560 [Bdellovibrionales bacterium]|nr:hypothetical protein [Bdellovibrionales bacterium]
MQTLRTSVAIFILAYCLVALGEPSSVYKVKSDFSLHSKLSDHSGRFSVPAQCEMPGQFEYHQQTRKTPLESGIFVSVQKIGKTQRATITSHDEMAFIDLGCLDCDVHQLDPSSTQRSPKNDFFFC